MINSDFEILKAHRSDYEVLTNIAFSAKRHWDYPDSYFDVWKDELTISDKYIDKNIVYKILVNNEIVGFYSIVENKKDIWIGEVLVQKGFWMEHIFIKPAYHQKGYGRKLINHAKKISNSTGITQLLIFVDPNATGFYEKIGAKFLYNSKSSIPGRMIPVYFLILNT